MDTEALLLLPELLSNGKVILCPTDTVWGLTCLASDVMACRRIAEIKNRTSDKYFVLLASSLEMISEYAEFGCDLAERALTSAERPTTVILNNGRNLPDEIMPEDKTLAFRIPHNSYLISIIDQLGEPIVSTSANLSGHPAPTSFAEIPDEIKNKVDFIVQGLEEKIERRSSRIVRFNDDGAEIVVRD